MPTCGGLGFVPDDDDHEEVIKTSRCAQRDQTSEATMKSILGVSLLILLTPPRGGVVAAGHIAQSAIADIKAIEKWRGEEGRNFGQPSTHDELHVLAPKPDC